MKRLIFASGSETIQTFIEKINKCLQMHNLNTIDNKQVYIDIVDELFQIIINIIEQYASIDEDIDINEYIAKMLVTKYSSNILNTLGNLLCKYIPDNYQEEIYIDPLNLKNIKQFFMTNKIFLDEVAQISKSILTKYTSNTNQLKEISTFNELIQQDDIKGAKYKVNSKFYMDLESSRDKSWVLTSGELAYSRKANGHGGLIEQYSDDLKEEEKRYDELNNQEMIYSPFAFGYVKDNVAVIGGRLGTKKPSINSLTDQLATKNTKVYALVDDKDIIIRTATSRLSKKSKK